MTILKLTAGFLASLFILWSGYNFWPRYSVTLAMTLVLIGLLSLVYFILRITDITVRKA